MLRILSGPKSQLSRPVGTRFSSSFRRMAWRPKSIAGRDGALVTKKDR